MEVIIEIIKYCGAFFLLLGGFFEIVGAIGITRMPDFFTRAHAATVAAVGGAVLPLLGIALISLSFTELDLSRLYLAGLCVITALLLLIIVPSGTHAIVRAAYISRKKGNRDRVEGA